MAPNGPAGHRSTWSAVALTTNLHAASRSDGDVAARFESGVAAGVLVAHPFYARWVEKGKAAGIPIGSAVKADR